MLRRGEFRLNNVPRAAFVPTLKQREWVATAAGAGVTCQKMARAIGVDKKTLRRAFEHELFVAAARRRLAVLLALHRAAMDGKVRAQRAYLARRPQPIGRAG